MLAAAGIVAVLLFTDDPLPTAGFWVVVSLTIGWIWRTSGGVIRRVLVVALLAGCVVTALQGGLFFIPAVLALGSTIFRPRRYRAKSSTP